LVTSILVLSYSSLPSRQGASDPGQTDPVKGSEVAKSERAGFALVSNAGQGLPRNGGSNFAERRLNMT
jgi:hypothetical protein